VIEYPAFFPCPTWAYQEQITANQDRSQFQCGWARQRRRWQQFNTDISLAFRMDTQTFANWSTWTEANGHNWFSIVINSQPLTIRFTTEVQAVYTAFDSVRVTVAGEMQSG